MPLSERLPKHGFPTDHPFNKDGYRYWLAEPDPHIPDTDPEQDFGGKPIPPKTYRIVQHHVPLLSANDRAPQLHMGDDRMTIKGEKGYSMVRGTHAVRKGHWYYEIELVSLPEENNSAVRVGFAQAVSQNESIDMIKGNFSALTYSARLATTNLDIRSDQRKVQYFIEQKENRSCPTNKVSKKGM